MVMDISALEDNKNINSTSREDRNQTTTHPVYNLEAIDLVISAAGASAFGRPVVVVEELDRGVCKTRHP